MEQQVILELDSNSYQHRVNIAYREHKQKQMEVEWNNID
jgi:hypothetical protein